jgi:UDPglucose--hexose-1-phosphate uridylyltransferase
MPEFRQNYATKEWIILAPERGKRPHDWARESKPETVAAVDPYVSDCPFCAGNEDKTTDAVYVWPSENDWQVRVVSNKFAALQRDLNPVRNLDGAFLAAEGFGIADVVIEHPKHDRTLATMTVGEVEQVLRGYVARQVAMNADDRVNLVTIFRNHGARAGTSLEHPHSQIIATPIVPPHVRYPIERAVHHYDQYGRCVYCDMLGEEIRQGDRVIMETSGFVAFCPFAAKSPFECRIYPKRHLASFFLLGEQELAELAGMLRTVLAKIYHGLHNPDYNYIIRSAPVGDHDTRYLHWYMVIIPKITIPAGFELGSGIYINTTTPEDAAEFLRETDIP